jgi:hypothetical protein
MSPSVSTARCRIQRLLSREVVVARHEEKVLAIPEPGQQLTRGVPAEIWPVWSPPAPTMWSWRGWACAPN